MSVFVGKSMCVAVTKARHHIAAVILNVCVDVCFIHFGDEAGCNIHSHHWLCESVLHSNRIVDVPRHLFKSTIFSAYDLSEQFDNFLK